MDIPPVHRRGVSSPSATASATVALATEAELEDFGAAISQELDRAEAELNAPSARPFGGVGASVMADVQRLRAEQFDMFSRHVQIEQQYRVASPLAEPHVRSMSFSAIADTMREKESATASLLNRLADFDNDLRQVIANVENEHSPSKGDKKSTASSGRPEAGGPSSAGVRPVRRGSGSYRRT